MCLEDKAGAFANSILRLIQIMSMIWTNQIYSFFGSKKEKFFYLSFCLLCMFGPVPLVWLSERRCLWRNFGLVQVGCRSCIWVTVTALSDCPTVYFPRCIFQNIVFHSVFLKIISFSKVAVTFELQWSAVLDFPKVYFTKCIIPKCIVKVYFLNVFFESCSCI